MSGLRSRWTVVALAPAFFLAGFGIVSTLVDSPDSEPSVPPGSTIDVGGGANGTEGGRTAPSTSANGATAQTVPTVDLGLAEGGGDGEALQASAPGAIEIDYCAWAGIFELENPQIVLDLGIASVVGELKYLGGVECQIGRVRVRAWFFDASGLVVGRTIWESVQLTGAGGEVTGREPLPFEAVGQISDAPDSASVRFSAVECL
jgi:hypothetical protein